MRANEIREGQVASRGFMGDGKVGRKETGTVRLSRRKKFTLAL